MQRKGGGLSDLQSMISESGKMFPGSKKGPDEHLTSALVAVLQTSVASYVHLKIMVVGTNAEMEEGRRPKFTEKTMKLEHCSLIHHLNAHIELGAFSVSFCLTRLARAP